MHSTLLSGLQKTDRAQDTGLDIVRSRSPQNPSKKKWRAKNLLAVRTTVLSVTVLSVTVSHRLFCHYSHDPSLKLLLKGNQMINYIGTTFSATAGPQMQNLIRTVSYQELSMHMSFCARLNNDLFYR